jgi:hypothetical protein
MKFTLTFKTPDVTDAIREQLANQFSGDDLENAIDDTAETVRKFIEYGENITVEFDILTQTAKVIPLRKV